MKIFISWSGERSRIIAEGLNDWLPNVFPYIEIFYSPNIEKGTKGGAEINATLEGTSFGIICLTPENLQNNWIHYEAGALAKINNDNSRVWTLLIGLNPSNIEQPLAQFQHTLTLKEDIYKLLESINKHLEKPLLENLLRKSFQKWWSELEDKIKEAELVTNQEQDFIQSDKNIRDDREVLDEVLEILRSQQRLFSNLENVGGRILPKVKPNDLQLLSYQLLSHYPDSSRGFRAIPRNKDEFIGVTFTVKVNDEEKAQYEKNIKKFLSATDAVVKDFSEVRAGFDVKIIFESAFDLSNLNEFKETVFEDFKGNIDDWEPIYVSDIADYR